MDQLVSVIVPIYKVEPYLRKCVDSLLAQDYENLEIVLVDDGSPDNCPQIADEYAQTHENVTTLHKPNGGLGDARNYGVEHAKGDWIAFVDSDDYVSQTYISDMADLVTRFQADMAVTNIIRRTQAETGTSTRLFDDFAVDSQTAVQDMYIRRHVGWEAVGKLFRKELLLRVPFPAGYYEDSACMYKITECCDTVAIGDYSGNYFYISRIGSILQSELKPAHFRIFDICSEFSDYYANREEMEITVLIFHQRTVLQLLRCQKMNYSQLKKIYFRYRALFRKNYCKLMRQNGIPRKVKIYNAMLCTTPAIFIMFTSLFDKLQRLKGV